MLPISISLRGIERGFALAAEPTHQEVEEWAAREKQRREAWVAGPTEAEKREWSRRQQHLQELRELYGARDESDYELERQLERRLRRDLSLAGVGMFDLILHAPFRLGAKLIRSGIDAQQDYYSAPAFRRRVPPEFSSDA